MKAKMLIFLVVLCLGLVVLVTDGFSATDKKKAEGTSLRLPLVHDSERPATAPRAPLKYPSAGGKVVTCDDINPEVGYIIQHDQIGVTGFDYQANGTLGRLIDVTNDGYRHLVYSYDAIEADPSEEEIIVDCKDPTDTWMGGVEVGPAEWRNRYPRVGSLNDGRAVVVSTYYAGTPVWHTALTVDDQLCGGFFTRKWDIPDRPGGGIQGGWPEMTVKYDVGDERDYIHIMTTERAATIHRLGYIRCYFDDQNDSLICETYHDGQTREYRIGKDTYVSDTFHPICVMDTSCFITGTLEASPVSNKVALVYMRPQYCLGSDPCTWNHEVAYIESQDNGDDWVAGNITVNQVTDYGCGDECGAFEVSACYDYNDDLHIVWITNTFEGGAGGGSYTPGWSKLYHWSEMTGISNITSGIYAGATPPQNCSNIHKPSISAKDPIYHPGGDSVFLFVVWSQTDTLDLSADEAFSNCDIWGVGSFDGGAGWARPFNLTRTNSDGCNPGDCVSEDYPNLAVNMYDGDLHIQYVCDLDPGAAWNGQGTWQENPVYYYHLSEWELEASCRTDHSIEPSSWCQPFLKVPPGETRTLTLIITNIGNAPCDYTVTSDDPCIDVSAFGDIYPGEEVPVSITVDGTGACEGTFIEGNVILWTSEEEKKIQYLPVQAVVAEDYYECPNDPETEDTLENDYMQFYTNANCQEWIYDISTFLSWEGEDTTIEVFFQGGTFVATTRMGDTLVGRYMGKNDQHAGAREKLYVEDRGDYWVLYTSRIFMHDLEPPMNPKWFWWEMCKEIVFFKPTASPALQHCVIKFVTVERHDPPTWWPDQTPFTNYEDTYIGVAMDIDCPFDSAGVETGDENGCNLGRYDDVNHIAYQIGFGREHSAYNNYYAGIALADGGKAGESIVPYGAHNVKNNQYLYPTSPWGWKDGELYGLASTAGITIQDGPPSPDSLVDRTQVLTAQHIPAGTDPYASAYFTVVEAVAPNGLSELQEYVHAARVWVENYPGLALCGDVNGDGWVHLGDIVYLINYLFRGGPPPDPPILRADVNGDYSIDAADIVYLSNYIFDFGAEPNCPGFPGYTPPSWGVDPLDQDTVYVRVEDCKVTPEGTDIPVTIWFSNDEDLEGILIPFCWTGNAYLDPDKNVIVNPTSEYYILRDYNGIPNRLKPYYADSGWGSLPFVIDSLNNKSVLFASGLGESIIPLHPGSGLFATFVFTCDQPTAPEIDTCYYPPSHHLLFVEPNNNYFVPEFRSWEPVDCYNSYSDPCLVACPLGDIPFKVFLRDSKGQPVANYSNVWLDLSDCSGIVPCATETSWPIVHPDGPSDENGVLTFRMHAGGCDNVHQAQVVAGCGLIGYVSVKTVDTDGDLMVRVNDWHGIGVDPCNDYNCNGEVNDLDVNIFERHIFHSCDQDPCLLLSPDLTVSPDTLLPVDSSHIVRLFIKNNNAEPCTAQFVKFYRAGFGQGPSLFQFATNYLWEELMQGDTITTEAYFVVPGPGSGYILSKLSTDCCDHSIDATFNFTKRMCPPDSMMYVFPLHLDVVPTYVETLEYMPDTLGWYWFIYETGGIPDSIVIVTPDTSALGVTGGLSLYFFDQDWNLLGYRTCEVRITLNSGDTNADCVVDLGDIVYMINYLYRGGLPPNPLRAGDVNCDCLLELGDVVYLINYLFRGGPPPVSSETCECGYKEWFPY